MENFLSWNHIIAHSHRHTHTHIYIYIYKLFLQGLVCHYTILLRADRICFPLSKSNNDDLTEKFINKNVYLLGMAVHVVAKMLTSRSSISLNILAFVVEFYVFVCCIGVLEFLLNLFALLRYNLFYTYIWQAGHIHRSFRPLHFHKFEWCSWFGVF